jgi:hypothetical protein
MRSVVPMEGVDIALRTDCQMAVTVSIATKLDDWLVRFAQEAL